MSDTSNAAVKNAASLSPERQLIAAVDALDGKRIVEIFDKHPGLDRNLAINGLAVLDYAVVWRDMGLARHMLALGACVDGTQGDEVTALMEAVLGGRRGERHEQLEAFVGLLLEHRADVTAADRRGNTALHFAIHDVIPSAQNIIRKLVAAGSDPFHSNNDGQTSFHEAARICCVESMKTLMSLTEGKAGKNLLAVRNTVTGKTVMQELQEVKKKPAAKSRMQELLSAYGQRRIRAAANGATRQPVPALRKLGRKP